MNRGNKIIINTIILYGRMLISFIISLISTRIVLDVLGVEDYGIYNIIVGVVTTITFINSSMAFTTQRFISYHLGTGKMEELKKYFEASFIVHLVLGFFVIIILEIIGPNFIREQLSIPEKRLNSTIILFHFVVVNTFVSIVTSPFDGSLASNENFFVIALTELFTSITRLLVASLLIYFGRDKLIFFGLLTTICMVSISLWKQIYCIKKYLECKISFCKPDKDRLLELLSFAGWNLFGSGAAFARGQGIAILLNVFYGVISNAAYSIANQVSGQLQSFGGVISKTIYPQLTQAEGSGNRIRMFKLSVLSSKISYLLISIISIPIIIEMEFILKIWLKKVPENAVIFTNLSLIFVMVCSLSNGLIAAVQSIGKIKIYQSIAGSLLILGLPTTYVFFKYGVNPYYAFYIAIIFEIITHIFRLVFLKKIASFSSVQYFINVDVKFVIITLIAFAIGYFSTQFFNNDIFRLIIVTSITTTIMVFGGYYLACNNEEKNRIKLLTGQIIKRIQRV